MVDRSQNSDFVKSVLFFPFREVGDLHLLQRVDRVVLISPHFVNTRVASVTFGKVRREVYPI